MPDNALVKFSDIEVKVKEKMKATFLDMIPEHAWDRITQEFLGKNGENIMKPLLEEALKDVYKKLIQNWLAEKREEIDRMFAVRLGTTFASACEALAPTMMNQFAKQVADRVLNHIQNNARLCHCGAEVPFGTNNCPRCGTYLS